MERGMVTIKTSRMTKAPSDECFCWRGNGMLLQRSKCSLKVLVSHLSSHLVGYERRRLTLFPLGSFQREERNLVNTESDETHACPDAHGPSPYHVEILINTVALISECKLPCEDQLFPGYQHYSRHLLFLMHTWMAVSWLERGNNHQQSYLSSPHTRKGLQLHGT